MSHGPYAMTQCVMSRRGGEVLVINIAVAVTPV